MLNKMVKFVAVAVAVEFGQKVLTKAVSKGLRSYGEKLVESGKLDEMAAKKKEIVEVQTVKEKLKLQRNHADNLQDLDEMEQSVKEYCANTREKLVVDYNRTVKNIERRGQDTIQRLDKAVSHIKKWVEKKNDSPTNKSQNYSDVDTLEPMTGDFKVEKNDNTENKSNFEGFKNDTPPNLVITEPALEGYFEFKKENNNDVEKTISIGKEITENQENTKNNSKLNEYSQNNDVYVAVALTPKSTEECTHTCKSTTSIAGKEVEKVNKSDTDDKDKNTSTANVNDNSDE